jgi:hypothetical protein
VADGSGGSAVVAGGRRGCDGGEGASLNCAVHLTEMTFGNVATRIISVIFAKQNV